LAVGDIDRISAPEFDWNQSSRLGSGKFQRICKAEAINRAERKNDGGREFPVGLTRPTGMMAAGHATLPDVLEKDPKRVSFGQTGFVERQADGSYQVWFGGSLLGRYEKNDAVSRDILIALVAISVDVRREDVARAFRRSPASVGRVLTRHSQGGMAAVAQKKERGPRKLKPPLRRQIYALFDQELSIRAAHRRVAKKLSYGRVHWLHKQWLAEKAAAAVSEIAEASVQLELVVAESTEQSFAASSQSVINDAASEQAASEQSDGGKSPSEQQDIASSERSEISEVDGSDGDNASPTEQSFFSLPMRSAANDAGAKQTASVQVDDGGGELPSEQQNDASAQPSEVDGSTGTQQIIDAGQVVALETVSSSREWVQHLGSWLMLAMLHEMGIYLIATKLARDAKLAAALRVALDATAIALSIGQKCVEGLRRLQTATQRTLLRYRGAAGPSWARSVLGSFAKANAVMFQAGVAKRLLESALNDDHRVFLYLDNHLRPYTGKHKIRKGWRMQDKRVVPGVSDYYLHDEDGCPLWRISTPAHGSLCDWFRPVIEFVAMALGPKAVPALIFDRGGSHANAMAEVRDLGAEFITYERKPYPLLPSYMFTERLKITLASKDKPIIVRYGDVSDKNLHRGRGRVRRIAVKMPDGEQLNVLAASTLPTEIIVRKILARWTCQENQFKHEVERWGINQLDGRTVEEYPEDAVIPNPARRKLEHQLKLAQAAEGRARCALARLEANDPKRERFEDDLQRATDRQNELKSLRPTVPAKAPVKETSLAGVLVRHPQEYKTVVDTLRIALANAEADLAQRLADHLSRPREAKKTLANLLAAPGKVTVRSDSVAVRLAPAGTRQERLAFARFLRHINRLKLSLPGDNAGRRLRFSLFKYSIS
jgi:hypothetical protein